MEPTAAGSAKAAKWAKWAGIALGVLVVIQIVPYGRSHSNPPVSSQPEWDSPETRELFYRACRDCHSNETEWPWYSHVAPVSWLVQYDVEEGRSHFNVSDWKREKKQHGDEAAEVVEEGEMPPWIYLPTNPEARLSDAQKERLVAGLEKTFGRDSEGGGHDHDSHEH